MHRTIDPAILYFGTPVVLISTLNEDGTPNLAPMSSAWWLRQWCVLGLDPSSCTPANLLRTGECVLNLPSVDQVAQVDRLACTTGTPDVPAHKISRGYRHVADKFGIAGLTPIPSDTVRAPRVAECPVQLEASLVDAHRVGADSTGANGGAKGGGPLVLTVRITRVHVEERLLMDGHAHRIDPEKWRPLMMSFQQFFGLGPKVGPSRLGEIPEDLYRRGKPPLVAPVPGQREVETRAY